MKAIRALFVVLAIVVKALRERHMTVTTPSTPGTPATSGSSALTPEEERTAKLVGEAMSAFFSAAGVKAEGGKLVIQTAPAEPQAGSDAEFRMIDQTLERANAVYGVLYDKAAGTDESDGNLKLARELKSVLEDLARKHTVDIPKPQRTQSGSGKKGGGKGSGSTSSGKLAGIKRHLRKPPTSN